MDNMQIPFSGEVLNYGLLGSLFLMSLLVIYNLFKMLLLEKDKRREDAEQLTNGLLDPIRQIRESAETQITLLRQLLDKVTKT